MFRKLLAGIDVGGVGLLFVLVVGVLVVLIEVDLFVEILWLFFFGGLVGVSDVVLVLPVDVLLNEPWRASGSCSIGSGHGRAEESSVGRGCACPFRCSPVRGGIEHSLHFLERGRCQPVP